MLSISKPVIYLATNKELSTKSYYRRLWMAVRNMPISRRDWLDEIADTLRDFDGVILYRSGKPFVVPLVDDVFGHDDDMRWLGFYMQPDRSGKWPKSKTRKLQRLQLLDLYFRIRHPDIARHFGK